MSKTKLPKDISAYVRNKTIKRILLLVALLAAFALANIYLWNEFKNTNAAVHALFVAISVILPFIISGVPLKMIDKSWRGEVISTEIREETGVYMHGIHAVPYTNHVIILKVKKDNGEIREVRAAEYGSRNRLRGEEVPNEGNIQHHMNDYGKGDLVYHFYGMPHNFVVSRDVNRPINCVICGYQNPKSDEKCSNCGHTLIKCEKE